MGSSEGLKGEAMENLMQGKCFVLKAKQNATLLSFGFWFFFQEIFALLCFVLNEMLDF